MAISLSSNKKSSIGKPSQSAVSGGHSNHMFGKSDSLTAKPETLVTHGSGGGNWAKGGSGHMCSYSGVKPAKAQ